MLADAAPASSRRGPRAVIVAMTLAVAAIAGLAYLDGARESQASLDDFAHDQETLAFGVSGELSARLVDRTAAPEAARDVLSNASRMERPGERVVLLIAPDGSLRTPGGEKRESVPLHDAFSRDRTTQWLSREEAAAVGLPLRRAVAGLAKVDAGPLGRWGVAVVSTAARERDRERRSATRQIASVVIAAALVLAFGTLLLRRQRRELELAHALELAKVRELADERLARASRVAMMGTLASGVAHEISTPLGVISGRAEQLLARADDDEPRARAVRAILDQTTRIGEIVRGFLDLARSGSPTLAHVPAEGPALAAIQLVEHRFEGAGVTLRADVAKGLPLVQGDARLLEHALVNLLLNACEACERGGHVEVSIRGEKGDLIYSVVDDGSGIRPDDVSRVTEPFFSTKPHGKGTGLGLAITSEIVKCHRGALEIGPHAPRGTVARIRLEGVAPAAP